MTSGDWGYVILFTSILLGLIFRPPLQIRALRLWNRRRLPLWARARGWTLTAVGSDLDFNQNLQTGNLGPIPPKNLLQSWVLLGRRGDAEVQVRPVYQHPQLFWEGRVFFSPAKTPGDPWTDLTTGEVLGDGVRFLTRLGQCPRQNESEIFFHNLLFKPSSWTWIDQEIQRIHQILTKTSEKPSA